MINHKEIIPMTGFQKIITPPLLAFMSVIVAMLINQESETFAYIMLITINAYSVYMFHFRRKELGILWMPYYYIFFVSSILLILKAKGII